MASEVKGISDDLEVWEATDIVAQKKGLTRSEYVMSLVRADLRRNGYRKLRERVPKGRPRKS